MVVAVPLSQNHGLGNEEHSVDSLLLSISFIEFKYQFLFCKVLGMYWISNAVTWGVAFEDHIQILAIFINIFRIVELEIGSSKPPSYTPILAYRFCLSKQGCILGGLEYPISLS